MSKKRVRKVSAEERLGKAEPSACPKDADIFGAPFDWSKGVGGFNASKDILMGIFRHNTRSGSEWMFAFVP
jgi:hypothetical protein